MCSDTPRLSILIPCYGTAHLVGRCLESLAALADKGIEIILADDCSPDNIPQAVAEALSRPGISHLAPVTRVISNPRNLGLPATRNRLFEEACGRHVLCIDSDDYADADVITHALDMARDMDMVISPLIVEKTGKSIRLDMPHSFDLNAIPVNVASFSLCNKIISRSFFTTHKLRSFENISRWEDVGLTSRIYALEPSIAVCPQPWYHYVIESDRATLSKFDRIATISDRSAIVGLITRWMAENNLLEKYTEFLTALKFYAKAGFLRRPVDLKAWRDTFPEARATLRTPRALPLQYRIIFGVLSMFS